MTHPEQIQIVKDATVGVTSAAAGVGVTFIDQLEQWLRVLGSASLIAVSITTIVVTILRYRKNLDK